jgi:hydroxypyruvate reductase
MPRTIEQLRTDALRIWQAGLDAVRAERLVRQAMRIEGGWLHLGDDSLPLDSIGRIAVVGAGKAGAGMAAAVEEILGPRWIEEKHVAGWVNVPENCVGPLRRIRLHGARPAGVNEPRPAGVAGSQEILRIVESLGPDDLCLCLISGGGSALLPAPIDGVSLDDKTAVTRHLSASGANIEQLNAVRKQLSRIKGGGLARRCRAGRLVSLIISDVLGDPLGVIASGPTVEDTSTPEAALAILEAFSSRKAGVPAAVFDALERAREASTTASRPARRTQSAGLRVANIVIGNNATAVDAAGLEAERLGYSHAMVSAAQSEGLAEDVGRHLAGIAVRMRREPGPDCLISGGEPVVKLVESARRGLGGRNQQLVLAAFEFLESAGDERIVILSGGTDGEDGPTDAAGAWIDPMLREAARRRNLIAADFLARNDAYHFFEPLDALIKTGPTHTNVCDLRVIVVDRR